MKKNDINKFTSKKPVYIKINEITINEKMAIIKDYYNWLIETERSADLVYSFLDYEKHLKSKK